MLTTVNRYKRFTGMPDDDTNQDGTIELLIMAATSAIEARCRRQFGMNTWTDVVDGAGGCYLALLNYPVHSVQEIKAGDRELEGYEIDIQRGMLYRSAGWPYGPRAVSVTYTAGYLLPSDDPQAPASTLPAALEYACVLLVPHMQQTAGVTSERVGDISVTYESGNTDLPSAVYALIRPYERPLT